MSLKEKLAKIFKGKDLTSLQELSDEFFEVLLESDVSFETAEEIVEKLRKRNANIKKLSREVAIKSIKDILFEILEKVVPNSKIYDVSKKPYVIMLVGINGTGKTTTVSKLSRYLKEHGKSTVIAASDTFRAGAIDQIKYLGEETGTRVIFQKPGSDPSSIAYDAIEHAKARNIDFVIIDTAGRMHSNRNLIDEMNKIKRVANPDMVLMVLDAIAASDAVEQAKTFKKHINYSGIVFNKLDTDARGGSIFTVANEIGVPIYFLGIGQSPNDIVEFTPEYIINKIFP
ncbi:signal recognition particle-docking protein FtsY [Caldiplasma sukawensis]